MNSRQRMKRRLLILAVGFLVLILLGGAVVMYRKHRIHEHFLQLRAQGLAAVKAKKYELALNDLGAFLGQDPTDLPSLEGYAAASMKVPLPGGRNLYQAASVLKQILYQKPVKKFLIPQLILYMQIHRMGWQRKMGWDGKKNVGRVLIRFS